MMVYIFSKKLTMLYIYIYIYIYICYTIKFYGDEVTAF